jgi:hypothetical protein
MRPASFVQGSSPVRMVCGSTQLALSVCMQQRCLEYYGTSWYNLTFILFIPLIVCNIIFSCSGKPFSVYGVPWWPES